jgi:ParB family transcriptional regulator, chromosome partitioning protein
MKKRGLGKNISGLGLSELLGDVTKGQAAVVATEEITTLVADSVIAEKGNSVDESISENRFYRLPIEKIRSGRYQPRQYFDEQALEELANSIRAQGIIQPIVVRRQEHGYELIAGERRWRAAQRAGLDVIPAIIQDLPEQAAMAIGLIENIQREDLNVLEEATAIDRLIQEFQLTHQEIAEAIGRSRTAITNLLRLLKLCPEVKVWLERGKLDMGHARALLILPVELQQSVAEIIIDKQLSVRQTELLVKQTQQQAEGIPVASPGIDPNIASLQRNVSERLSAKVLIRHQAKGKGQLVIHYNSLDELDGILDHIK